MACLNINGLLCHADNLRLFLSTTNIDILAVNETKLDNSILNDEVHIPGFDIVRKDRAVNGKNGGGVCFYIKTNLNFYVRNDLCDDDLEILSVELTKPRSKSFIVSTWYRPPGSSLDLFKAFEDFVDKVDSFNLDYYILGDFNCDLKCSAGMSPATSHLNNIVDVYGLTQLITEPTRVTNTSSTLIDVCYTNNPDKITRSGVYHLGISDHSLVFMTRKAKYEPMPSRTVQFRNWKKS